MQRLIATGEANDDGIAEPGEAVVARLTEILPPDVAVTTNWLDCVAALRMAKVRRPFLVFPAWFGDDTLASGVRYFSDQGFDPAAHRRHDLGRSWRDLPPGELYAHGLGFEQDAHAVHAQVRAACPDAADGGIIDALERDLGRPVISANQASLWHCLRLAGVQAPVSGYGRLLRLGDGLDG